MRGKDRTVADKTKAEFKKRAPGETYANSTVKESLDRMAGSSQDIVKEDGRVRDKLHRKAKELKRP